MRAINPRTFHRIVRDSVYEVLNPMPLGSRCSKGSVQKQGKVVIEKDGTEYLIMLPDGEIRSANSHDKAEAIAKKWFKKNLKEDVGIGTIEWR
jgi:hypothetical protein